MRETKFLQQGRPISGLVWGLRKEFRDYIERLFDGQVSAISGAEILETGEAFFPVDNELTTTEKLRFIGGLQFTGHRGMLAVTVLAPWIQNAGDSTVLTIEDPFEAATRMQCVTVDLREDGTGTTRLTEEGTDLFMANYQAGIAFDPIRIVWAGKD